MNLLFVCTYNKHRSPTAEQIFKKVSGLSVRSVGTSNTAIRHVSAKDLEWAEIIFVMEKKHEEHLEEIFPAQMKNKKIINLNIPDEYSYMDPDLIEMLKREVTAYLAN